MMIAIQTTNGTVTVSEFQIYALWKRADESAALVAEVLRAMGFTSSKESKDGVVFPRNFLLEFAAVLQLKVWELHGQRHHIDAGLPSSETAVSQLLSRAASGQNSFEGGGTELHFRVLRYWREGLAWQGMEYLSADIALGAVEEEEFLDGLAEYIWSHRHQRSDHLPSEGEKR